jgi:hypothetical protein
MPDRLDASFQQLWMRFQVLHRIANSLLNRYARSPTKSLELGRVEMDERRVAKPPALASRRGISNSFQVEFVDNDVRQIQYVHKRVVSEIEDVLAFFGVFKRVKDSVDAINDIKVRLALPSISQDFKCSRIFSEFLHKVEYDAVRITFADPRHETKDMARDTEIFAVGLNHGLARKLAGSIEAGLERRIALRRREDIRFTVNCGATREDNLLNSIDSHCLQDIPRSDRILLEVDFRSRHAASHVGIRLKVEHDITSCHFLLEPFAVEDVGANYPDLGISGMVADELLLACAEIVVDSYAASRLSKPIDDVASDKAATSSHECSACVSQIHIFH